MNWKKLYKFAKDNYFITIFIAIILFVGAVSVYKMFYSKATFVYAKVKLGQGLWWAGGQKPGTWLATSIQKGDVEKDLVGKPIAEVLSVRYYPWYVYDQYDVYLTLKLRVSVISKAKKYNFKRNTLGIGTPIELELSSAQVNGTVIDLSESPFEDKYVEKTVILIKKYAYPWEYDGIKAGDKYFDGENTVFEVTDKALGEGSYVFSPQRTSTSNIISQSLSEQRQTITVKAKLKVKETGDQFIFGEEQKLYVGKTLTISTPVFNFQDYIIGKIE